MIIDKIENIDLYSNIAQEARDFIKNLTPDIKSGKVELSKDIYANIEEYTTKDVSKGRFESHNNYIDIQLLLSGNENIYIADRSDLTISENYNKNRDITFYSDDISKFKNIELNGKNFIMVYPHEAHAPQIAVNNNTDKVKKVVVKIKFDYVAK